MAFLGWAGATTTPSEAVEHAARCVLNAVRETLEGPLESAVEKVALISDEVGSLELRVYLALDHAGISDAEVFLAIRREVSNQTSGTQSRDPR